MTRAYRPIHTFIAVSLLLHAAIVLVIVSTRPATHLLVPASLSSAPSLSVQLTKAGKKQASVSQRHAASPTVQGHVPATPANTPPVRSALNNIPINDTQRAQVQHRYTAEYRHNEIRDRVLSRLQVDMQRYFTYPLLAQRQGWQGRVLLGFSVEANGAIHNIHIAAGSGYDILDNSALAALARVQRLHMAASWLEGNSMELQMPVIFHLQGG